MPIKIFIYFVNIYANEYAYNPDQTT